jgi:predicted nucleic acid-binding protein
MAVNLEKFLKKHKIIGLDSMLFIYHFERHKKFAPKTKIIFENLEKGKFKGISSTIGLLEILIKPKKEKNFFLVKEYKELLTTFPNLSFANVDLEVADLASSLRAKYSLTTADAILVGSALKSKATGFITSDIKLKKIKEVEVFVLR